MLENNQPNLITFKVIKAFASALAQDIIPELQMKGCEHLQ